MLEIIKLKIFFGFNGSLNYTISTTVGCKITVFCDKYNDSIFTEKDKES